MRAAAELTDLDGRVRLADYVPTPADVHLKHRSVWQRVLRVLLLLAVWPVVALVAFLIPPHGETLFLALGIGAYLIYREATTRYVVQHFRGTCPRCGSALGLKPGSRLTAARSLPCYGCHFHPVLEIPTPTT